MLLHPEDARGKALKEIAGTEAVMTALDVVTGMAQNIDVSDEELVAAARARLGEHDRSSAGPQSKEIWHMLADHAGETVPFLAARIRKIAARSLALLVAQGQARTEADIVRGLHPCLLNVLPPAVHRVNEVGSLAGALVLGLLPRLRSSKLSPAAWCQDFEARVDAGNWGRPIRRSPQR